MNAKIIAITIILINPRLTTCHGKKYVNFSLYNVFPTEQGHLQFLQNLNYKRYIGLTFWKRSFKLYEDVQFIVNPVNKDMFEERARNSKVYAREVIPDIQKAFDDQVFQQYKRKNSESFNWYAYHTYEDVCNWLSDIEERYVDLVHLVTIGKSAEGRDIRAAVVKKRWPKLKVIVEGGIHANEWISVEFVTYLLDQLLKVDENSNWKMTALLTKYEWHLIPIVNPDGYIYNQKQDRLWRKNRNPHENSIGVDLNRNFDYKFGKYGAIHDENDDQYCGPHVFSEPESLALAKHITKISRDTKFYFSIHGYGQKFIIPYVDKKNRNDNYGETENFGRQAIWKIYQKHGVRYNIGTGYELFGQRISGTTASYVKKTHDIRFVYTILLRDNGTYGHALPPDMILPACEEMMTGLKELMNAKYKKMKLQLFNDCQQPKEIIFLILICAVLVL